MVQCGMEISHPCIPSPEAGRGWLYPELVLRRMSVVQRTLLCNPSILGHPGSPPGNLDLSTTAPSYHTTASPCIHGASGGVDPACSDTDRPYSRLPVPFFRCSLKGLSVNRNKVRSHFCHLVLTSCLIVLDA